MNFLNVFTSRTENGIHYYEGGEGPVIVLLHGLPESATLWRKVAPALAEQSHVIIPDLPGSGKSPLPQGPLTVDGMAENINDLLLSKGYDKYTLVGHSMGGYVALAMLEKFPENIHCIALVHSTAKADSEEKKQQRAKSASLLRRGGKAEYLKLSVEKMFAPEFLKAHPKIYEEQLARADAMPAENLALYNEALAARPDRTQLLQHSKVPFQWILGAEDQIIAPDDVLPLVAQPALSFLSLYKGVGHLSMLEAPERVVADLNRFSAFCSKR